MKEYIKRHYCTKHPAKFNGIKGQLRFVEIEQFKECSSMQKIFHAYEKYIEFFVELSFKVSEVIQEKEKLWPTVMINLFKNCLLLFTRRLFPEKKCVVKELSLPWHGLLNSSIWTGN